jgi:intermediate peptidase
MLNLPPPGWSKPTLLSGSMVDNLFHEMGHAMHSMLARTKYQHVTGTRCSTDFAEVPSTLMEYFASDPRVLHHVSNHYQSGEKLPMAVLEKFVASRKVFSGADIQTQLCYSILDQRLHASSHPLQLSTTEIMRQIHTEHHNLPFPEGTAWQHRFSHLVRS